MMVQPPDPSAGAGPDRRKIIVDIVVTPGRRIIALRPEDQSAFIDPISAREILTSNSVSSNRINNRVRGRLIGKSFEDAIDLVNKYGGMSKPGEYGSLYMDFLECMAED